MTSLRESVRRLLSRTEKAAPPDPEYSYTIYWAKTVRGWEQAQRKQARLAVEQIVGQPEFEATAFERRYGDEHIDDSMHAGESLLALHKVLTAFERDSTEGFDKGGV